MTNNQAAALLTLGIVLLAISVVSLLFAEGALRIPLLVLVVALTATIGALLAIVTKRRSHG